MRFAVPGFLIVTVSVLVTPTVTLVKLIFEGITVIAGCIPVPLKEILAGEFVALLTTLIVPAEFPTPVGAKPMERGRLCPGASVADPVNPLTLKPEPV